MAWDNPTWTDRKSFGEWFTQDGKYKKPDEDDQDDVFLPPANDGSA